MAMARTMKIQVALKAIVSVSKVKDAPVPS